MSRAFTEHTKRGVTCLDGGWNFKTDPNNVGLSEGWVNGFSDGSLATVPSVWNTELGLAEYVGVAFYQRDFYFEGGTLRLLFDAVQTEAEVWLDDSSVGKHYGGFTAFDIIVTNVSKGYHRLTVRVDNSFDEQSIPQAKVDWYHYGGIIRSVYAQRLCGVAVMNNRFDYTLSDDLTSAEGSFTVELYNAEAEEVTTPLEILVGDKPFYSTEVTLSAGESKTLTTPVCGVNNVSLWDTESPNLCSVSISTETDDLMDRIGFRRVEAKPDGVYLNGRKIELRGVNRHEEYPDFGFAFPKALMKKDIDIITALGCNTIRGSHYPNSKYFLDLLDANGIMFWSEIPIWGCGFPEEILGDPVVVERGLNMHREMLSQYFNHPSIIIWGMHNEIRVDTENAYNMSKLYYEYLKKNGGNRLVTYATYIPLKDICTEFCDIWCINMYYGWYFGEKEDWPQFLKEAREYRKQRNIEHKPVIMSEFGCAAIYGDTTFTNVRWTEEYQAEMLSLALKDFHKDDMVAGFYIWQYSDIRTCWEAGMTRARGFNNKGIVNEHRKPKLSYFEVKRLYHEFIKEEKGE